MKTLVRFSIYFVGLALLTITAVVSLHYFDFKVMKENNIIEWFEVLWLLISSLFLFLAARNSVEYARLFAVLYLLPLIAASRELDGVLDIIFHGAWVIPAVFISLVLLSRIFRSYNILKSESLSFMHTQQVVFLGLGVFIVVIFAQICGQQSVMRAVLDGQYHRSVGRFVEEFVEFLGYIILIVGSLECYLRKK